MNTATVAGINVHIEPKARTMAKIASQHAAKLDAVTRVAGWIAPLIMIYVGIYILMDTATDVI